MPGVFEGPLTLGVAGLVTCLTTLAASRLAMYAKFLPDRPNHRSSHDRVISRGGGIAIFAGWFAGVFIVAVFADIMPSPFVSVFFAGLAALVFCVGLADDRWSMTPLFKFSGQLAAAGLFCWLLGPLLFAPIPFLGEVSLGAWGVILTLLWIVGFMNAFNFMDGVNGIAGGSALAGLIAFSVIAIFAGAPGAAILSILLALACFGFLPSNLGKGRLFMGDSGSLMIAFLIAGLGIYAANVTNGRASVMIMPVIFLPFLFDVAWTLTHRIIRKQNILAGHREHLYQLLLRQGLSHAKVASLYMALTTFSAGAAILMLALAPSEQWIAPAALMVLFALGASYIHAGAVKDGLLTPSIARKSGDMQPAAAE